MGDGILAAAGAERAFGRRDPCGCGGRKSIWDRFYCGSSGELMAARVAAGLAGSLCLKSPR